jgi:hypothetical protein
MTKKNLPLPPSGFDLLFKQLTFAIASTLLIGADFGDRYSSTSVAQLDRWFTELTKGLFAIPLRLPI